ncbi:MAG: hypothetical protein ACD_21C00129G0005 [uncultured bacterium]|nr:MAG: hypothetical protein ACD_21C00129G0005 [uncultured bacterium]
MPKNNQLNVKTDEPLVEGKSYSPDLLPNKTEQMGKNAGEILAISDAIKANPNSAVLKAKYIQKELECRAGEALRDETEDFLEKGRELISEADVALLHNENSKDFSVLRNHNDSLKKAIKKLKQGVQLLGFKVACDCKELQRTIPGIEENIQIEIDDILKENNKLIANVNLLLKNKTPINIASINAQNHSLQKLIGNLKNSIQLMVARIYSNYQKLQNETEKPEETQNIVISTDKSDDIQHDVTETNIEDKLEQLQKESIAEMATAQDMSVALQKGKPQVLDWSLLDKAEDPKDNIKKAKKLLNEIDQEVRRLRPPHKEPLVLLEASVKTGEGKEFSNKTKELWEPYCEENGKKHLESYQNTPASLQGRVTACLKTIKEKEAKTLEIAKETEENDKLISIKEKQLDDAISKLERELIKEWKKIEKLYDHAVSLSNFKKFIQNCIVAQCKILCWPDKGDYKDKYSIALGQELENYFKRNKDTLKIEDDQLFEFLSEIRFLILNSLNVSPIVDVALEIDALEIKNKVLEEDLEFQEERIVDNRREIGDADKSFYVDTQSDIRALVEQDTIREKLEEFLDVNGKTRNDIEKFDDIYCDGLSFLWLYAKWLFPHTETCSIKNDDGLEVNNSINFYDWFQSTIQLIKNWDTERKLAQQENVDIRKLILLIWHFRHVGRINKKTTKKSIQDTVAEITKREFKVEYSIASLFTLEQLKQLLGLKNFIQNNKLVLVTSYNSTTAVFKADENYYYFDPNSNFEEIQIISTDVLAKLVFNAHFYIGIKPSPLGFTILSTKEEQKAEYPLQKDVLGAINPALVPEKRYAHEISGLIIATKIGDLESVRCFLNKGVDPNKKTTSGSNPLMFAAVDGHLEIVKTLLKNQPAPDINAKNKYGCTALIYAVRDGCLEVVKELLTVLNIDLNVQCKKQGQTALIYASKFGYADIVKILLTIHEIDLNIQDNDGYTALLHAAKNGDIGVVKELLTRKEIDPNIQENFNNLTALMLACKDGNIEIAKALLAHPNLDPNVQNYYGTTALTQAAYRNYVDIVNLLLAHPNINVNLENSDHSTSIMSATVFNQTEAIKALLKHSNIDPNTQDGSGNTPLIWAANNNYLDIVEALLAHLRIEPNIRGSFGYTALMEAAFGGYREVVAALLEHPKTDPNAQNDSGYTALMRATYQKHIDVVKTLLAHKNIDANLRDKRGETALGWPMSYKEPDTIKTLLEHSNIDPNTESIIVWASREGHIDIVKLLLMHHNIDPNIKDHIGDTALTIAAEKNHIDIVKVLLMHSNIDPNIKNKFSHTSLLKAAQYGHLEIIIALLDHPKIDPNIQDDGGNTALIEAARREYVDIIKVLLKHQKIDPNIRDNIGHAALTWPMRNKCFDIIKVFLECGAVDLDEAFVWASTMGYLDIVNKILLVRPNIGSNIKDHSGDNILRIALRDAVMYNKPEVVKVLLAHSKIYINLPDNYGDIALMMAIKYKYLEIVKELIKHPKIDFSVRTKDGKTIFEIDTTEEIKQLLQKYKLG